MDAFSTYGVDSVMKLFSQSKSIQGCVNTQKAKEHGQLMMTVTRNRNAEIEFMHFVAHSETDVSRSLEPSQADIPSASVMSCDALVAELCHQYQLSSIAY